MRHSPTKAIWWWFCWCGLLPLLNLSSIPSQCNLTQAKLSLHKLTQDFITQANTTQPKWPSQKLSHATFQHKLTQVTQSKAMSSCNHFVSVVYPLLLWLLLSLWHKATPTDTATDIWLLIYGYWYWYMAIDMANDIFADMSNDMTAIIYLLLWLMLLLLAWPCLWLLLLLLILYWCWYGWRLCLLLW